MFTVKSLSGFVFASGLTYHEANQLAAMLRIDQPHTVWVIA
jgi:hypothetical protein